ncbi:MAG: PQQ-dependent sugar dehydrogenase [Deltaproteobacteria bacterium]|nr:PQQ-dependent sugar dehydrogenase [Deltaproteobacteria bacterium]
MRKILVFLFLAVFFLGNVWWLTVRIDNQEEIRLARVAEKEPALVELTPLSHLFSQPLGVTHAKDSSGRLYILEQGGKVWVVRSDGSLQKNAFLDVSHRLVSSRGERGLLGLAFHPNFRSNGQVFIHYSAPGKTQAGVSTIARIVVNEIENKLKPTTSIQVDEHSHEIILEVEQPLSNHNGGHLAFGKDGMLYIGFGDGGGADDRLQNSRKTDTLLAKLLRIDVNRKDNGRNYHIPDDNPFVGKENVKPEIWAMGLRNPWRFAFNDAGGLFIADVGQNMWEEVNFVSGKSKGGEDYGWNEFEGTHCFNSSTPCQTVGKTMPIFEYNHDDGCSVSGGVVNRSSSLKAHIGSFLFGDFCSGKIWAVTKKGKRTLLHAKTKANISAFGESESGQVYMADLKGQVFLLRAKSSSQPLAQ